MIVSILCLISGGVMAVVGKALQIMQQYDASLYAWGIVVYVLAGVMGLAGIIDGITTVIRIHRRNQRLKGEENAYQVLAFHSKRPINGIYVGGNDKNKQKSAEKTATGKKRGT